MNNSRKSLTGNKEKIASAYLKDLATILFLPTRIANLRSLPILEANETGIIEQKRAIKLEIANSLGITFGTLDNYLSELGKAGVIQRISRGKFSANSDLLALKALDDLPTTVREEKTVFRMSVDYLASGKKRIEASLVNQLFKKIWMSPLSTRSTKRAF